MAELVPRPRAGSHAGAGRRAAADPTLSPYQPDRTRPPPAHRAADTGPDAQPLISQKFVERDRAADDGRVYELRLTQAGLDAAALVETSLPQHEADLLRFLSVEERQTFLALLDKAIAGAEAALEGQEKAE
uniref:MarR family winged helix-turn-helix transcriptional regulator n=1 Tax=Neorhizobium sp. EC2-8 TaxID=3129230 RepID=UPI003101AB9A